MISAFLMRIPGMSISIPWEYAVPMFLLAILAVPVQILLCKFLKNKHWRFMQLYAAGILLFILLLAAVATWTGLDNNKVIFTLFSPFSSYGIILWGTGLILFLVGVGLGFLLCYIWKRLRK